MKTFVLALATVAALAVTPSAHADASHQTRYKTVASLGGSGSPVCLKQKRHLVNAGGGTFWSQWRTVSASNGACV